MRQDDNAALEEGADGRPVRVVGAEPGRATAFSIHICALVLATGAIYFARDIFLPIVLGLLIALTVIPIVRWLDRRGIPPTVSAFLIVISIGLTIAAAALALTDPVSRWLSEAPEIGRQVEEKIRGLRYSMRAITDAGERIDEVSEQITADPAQQEVVLKEPGFLSDATSTAWTAVTTTAISLLLVLFLLASGDMIYIKIIRVLPTLTERKTAIRIVHDIERAISRYLLTVTLINAGLGLAIGVAMWALGMPSPALWGLAAAALNFLPYVGAIIGVGLTGLVAVISFEELGQVVMVPLTYLALTAVEGNIVTPMIVGRRLQINTVAIFLGVAFWGWVWGLVGVLIAVPVLVVIKTVCDHLPSWRTLGEFLSASSADLQDADEPSGEQ